MASTDDTIDGQEPDQSGAQTVVSPAATKPATTSHFITADEPAEPVEIDPPKKKPQPLSLAEAEMAGDYEAVAAIELANARREIFEHTDVNDDGNILGGPTHFLSGMFQENQYGQFYSDGIYHDNFGGTYDSHGGYNYGDGSYMSGAGSYYNAKTNKITRSDGTERKPPPGVTKPEDVKAVVKIDSAVHDELHGNSVPTKTIDPKAAATKPGGALHTGGPTTAEDEGTTDQLVKARQAAGISLSAPIKPGEIAKAHTAFLQAQSAQKALAAQYKAEKGQQGGLTAVTGAEAQKAHEQFESLQHKAKGTPAPTAAPAATATDTPAATSGAGDVAKINSQVSDILYKDTKSSGYWDASGGYYDGQGGYWDPQGGYTDPQGGYTDVSGNHTFADGTFMDAKGNYVDTSGALWTADGQKFDAQKGIDYVAKLKDAETNNTTYVPAGKGTNITIQSDDDSPGPVTPVNTSSVQLQPPLLSNLSDPPPPPPIIDVTGMGGNTLPDLSQLGTPSLTVVPAPPPASTSTTLNLDGSKYTAPDLSLSGTGVVSGTGAGNTSLTNLSTIGTQIPLTTPDDDFYSMFNGFKTSIVDNKAVVETKFFDPTSALGAPLLTSGLALTTPTTLTTPVTPVPAAKTSLASKSTTMA